MKAYFQLQSFCLLQIANIPTQLRILILGTVILPIKISSFWGSQFGLPLAGRVEGGQGQGQGGALAPLTNPCKIAMVD